MYLTSPSRKFLLCHTGFVPAQGELGKFAWLTLLANRLTLACALTLILALWFDLSARLLIKGRIYCRLLTD